MYTCIAIQRDKVRCSHKVSAPGLKCGIHGGHKRVRTPHPESDSDESDEEKGEESEEESEERTDEVQPVAKRRHVDGWHVLIKGSTTSISTGDRDQYVNDGYAILDQVRMRGDKWLVVWADSWIPADQIQLDADVLDALPVQ